VPGREVRTDSRGDLPGAGSGPRIVLARAARGPGWFRFTSGDCPGAVKHLEEARGRNVRRGRRAFAAIAPAEAGAVYSSLYTASDPSFSQTSTFDTRTRSPSLSAIFRFASSKKYRAMFSAVVFSSSNGGISFTFR
jgi:hypothetical protein